MKGVKRLKYKAEKAEDDVYTWLKKEEVPYKADKDEAELYKTRQGGGYVYKTQRGREVTYVQKKPERGRCERGNGLRVTTVL